MVVWILRGKEGRDKRPVSLDASRRERGDVHDLEQRESSDGGVGGESEGSRGGEEGVHHV